MIHSVPPVLTFALFCSIAQYSAVTFTHPDYLLKTRKCFCSVNKAYSMIIDYQLIVLFQSAVPPDIPTKLISLFKIPLHSLQKVGSASSRERSSCRMDTETESGNLSTSISSFSFNPKEQILETTCLCRNRQLLQQTARLLNSQWPRSMVARLHYLEKESSDTEFPKSIVLFSRRNEVETVIGYSKLSILWNKKDSCHIESVLIDKNERGKGYGRLIMEKSEDYATQRGIQWIYLTTQDQVEFYRRLGYELCQPFTFCGSLCSVSLQERLTSLQLRNSIENSIDSEAYEAKKSPEQSQRPNEFNLENQKNLNPETESSSTELSSTPSAPAPPAPPPAIQLSSLPTTMSNHIINCSEKVYMKKRLNKKSP